MTFVFAAIFILLAMLSPVAALVFGLGLLAFAVGVFVVDDRRGAHDRARATVSRPADLPDRVITGPDHPLAAIGGVPREEG